MPTVPSHGATLAQVKDVAEQRELRNALRRNNNNV